MNLNKFQLIGRLGKNPEMSYTPNGKPQTVFSIAVDRRKKNGDAWETVTDWFNMKLWGDQARNANEYLVKGQFVYIEGRLEPRKYEKEGVTHFVMELVIIDLKYGPKPNGGGSGNGKPAPAGSKQVDEPVSVGEDEFPF